MTRATVAGGRTFLFAPASRPEILRKALDSAADVVIADLEDGVALPDKDRARATVAALLREHPARPLSVRINSPINEDGQRDLAALPVHLADALVVPKVTREALERAPAVSLIGLVETAAGVEDAQRIAHDPRIARLLLGSLDLRAELGVSRTPSGSELAYTRGRMVIASAHAGLPGPIDGPFGDFTDHPGLLEETAVARAVGFTGKCCIHPRQIDPVSDALAPTRAETDWARRVLAATAATPVESGGVTALNGGMIDPPVVARARRIAAETALGGTDD